MDNFKFTLEKYSGKNSRFTCPKCGKPNEFTRYVNSDTGEYIDDTVGKCNRIDKCGYHFTPKQYDNNQTVSIGNSIKRKQPAVSKNHSISYIDEKTLNESINHDNYKQSNFINYMTRYLDREDVDDLIKRFKIGTMNYFGGMTTLFLQIDINNKIRTGKLIKFDPDGHKIDGKINWVHAVLKLEKFNLKQCFFGEHLLKESLDKKVGIVESEKTAIMLTGLIPEMIWLASGSAEGLNDEKVQVLQNREVTLFPDASVDGKMYIKWAKKAKKNNFEVSDYLEIHATYEQKRKGVDLADFLIPINNSSQYDQDKQLTEKTSDKQKITKKGDSNTNIDIFKKLLEPPEPIPYETPSKPAIIDSKIEDPPYFSEEELALNSYTFRTANNDFIKIIESISYGPCNNWEKHKKAKGYCKACILNQLHIIKINGVIQSRGYSHLEILIMANSGITNKQF